MFSRPIAPRLTDDPSYWRARGEEIRVVAEAMQDINASGIMFRIAEDYERLAKCAEERSDSLCQIP